MSLFTIPYSKSSIIELFSRDRQNYYVTSRCQPFKKSRARVVLEDRFSISILTWIVITYIYIYSYRRHGFWYGSFGVSDDPESGEHVHSRVDSEQVLPDKKVGEKDQGPGVAMAATHGRAYFWITRVETEISYSPADSTLNRNFILQFSRVFLRKDAQGWTLLNI